jgi:hypothetical protein
MWSFAIAHVCKNMANRTNPQNIANCSIFLIISFQIIIEALATFEFAVAMIAGVRQ